ncbi:MAG: substrate-binding domain-containing protein [Oscillospiraceae bacterium]|nr:substrate-binding domain-containing protein [Oscillospiraceae bacterium]
MEIIKKTYPKILIGVALSAAAILSAVFAAVYCNKSNDKYEQTDFEYHFQVFVRNQDEQCTDLFKRGIEDASLEYKVCTEVMQFNDYSEELYRAVMCAAYAGIDAVALEPDNSSQLSYAVARAREYGTQVVLYLSDNDRYKELLQTDPFYNIARSAAVAFAESDRKPGKTAVVLRGTQNPDSMSLRAIRDVFKLHEGLDTDYIWYVDSATVEIDKLTRDIVDSSSMISGIICLDEKSTPVIASSLININRINDITIVGYGYGPQTMKYIEDGVINASVSSDMYEAGRSVVTDMYCSAAGISAYEKTSVNVTTVKKQVMK